MAWDRAWRPVFLALMFFVVGGLPHVRSNEQVRRPVMPMIKSMTELKAGDNGHFFTTASINNRDVRVLVDTGATTVALSYEDARTVGLRPSSLSFDVPVSTANGVTKAASVMLDEIEIDGVRVNDVSGMVLPEGAMRGSLLGMSFLAKLSSFKVEDGVLTLKE